MKNLFNTDFSFGKDGDKLRRYVLRESTRTILSKCHYPLYVFDTKETTIPEAKLYIPGKTGTMKWEIRILNLFLLYKKEATDSKKLDTIKEIFEWLEEITNTKVYRIFFSYVEAICDDDIQRITNHRPTIDKYELFKNSYERMMQLKYGMLNAFDEVGIHRVIRFLEHIGMENFDDELPVEALILKTVEFEKSLIN